MTHRSELPWVIFFGVHLLYILKAGSTLMENNNFGFLRFLFACFVVITHAFILAGAKRDILDVLTNDQLSFAYIGLSGFFIISGYLVFQSVERSRSLAHYFRKRVLRIFPGLGVVLLLTIVFASLAFDSGFNDYLSNRSMWTYVPNNLSLIYYQGTINGVFTGNPYSSEVNGSLWSLFYEFVFYTVLAFFVLIPTRNRALLTSFILVALLIARAFFFEPLSKYSFVIELRRVVEFGPFFFAGSFLAAVQFERISKSGMWLCMASLFFILFTIAGQILLIKYVLLPVIVILFGIHPIPSLSLFTRKIGDISYGIYIYAFPIQQVLLYCCDLSPGGLLVLSLPLALLAGYFSWHVVEKKFLSYKNTSLRSD